MDNLIDIWSERIGWWQYNYDLEKQFKFTSKRLAKFIKKRYTISDEWTIITKTATIIANKEEWEKLYLGKFTNIFTED